MKEYLAFVDEIGMTSDGDFIYQFDFTTNTDVVWGDYFNMAPSVIIPALRPDENCLSSRAKAVFPKEMLLAKRNSCFSMQDCIDGIIAMIFSEIDDDTIEVDGKPFYCMFAEERESVEEKLKKLNINFYDNAIIETGDSSAIDSIIDGGLPENDDENDDF